MTEPPEGSKIAEPVLGCRHVCLVIGLFVGLSVLVTYPSILVLDTQLMGMGDLWQHMWNLWWFDKAVTELLRSPYFTDYVYYPTGASLASQSFSEFNLMLAIPLKRLLGPVVTYNVLVLFSYVASATGAYFLCHHLTRNVYASLVAGVAFAFSPFRVSHLMFFHVQSTQWLPFFVLSLLKLWERPRYRYSLLAGIFLALATLCTPYHLLFLVMFTSLFVAYRVVVERRVPLKPLKHVAVAHAAALLMVLPFLLPLLREVAEGESYLRVDFHHIFSADLLSFVLPPEHHPIVGQWVTATYHRFNTDYRERVNYLGLSLLFLSAYGLIRPAGEKGRTNTFWWVALIAFCGLALGPFLQVRGNTYESIVLPFELFRDLPFFNIMRAPTRFVSLATLCVAVLAGLGTLSLLKGAAKRSYGRTPIREATITGCLVVIVLFDVWTWPAWPLSAASMPSFYDELARERRDYAILEVPLPHIFNPLPLYYQTAHEKKLVGGYVSRPPQEAERFINANPFLASLVEPDRKYTGYILAREAENAYEILSTHDIEWVVVHNVGTSPAASLIAQWLSGVYDGPDHSANGLQAFRVDPAVGRERFLDSPHVSDERQLPASLYASEWFGMESYRVSLPVGRYRVRLKFAEIFFDRPGERVFSVRIEGQDALRDFDIVKEVGALTPIDKDFDVYVEDGVLDIDFDAVRNLAKLSGLEIWRNGETVFATSAGDEVDHPWDGSHGYTGPAGFYRTRRAMESVPR